MKRTIKIIMMLLIACIIGACSSDNDADLSRVERSLLGYWQVVEIYNNSYQEPIDGIQVVEFKPDRTQRFYKDGQLQYETQFWSKPVKDNDSYYLYHQQDLDYSQSTFSCTFKVEGNKLTIYESGCFSFSKTVYVRIQNLNDVNPNFGTYNYEENPTTLEGAWHLVKANYGFGGICEFAPGDVTVYFNSDNTIRVINKDTKEMKHFKDSGFYSYEIIQTNINKTDGTVFTTINLDGQNCTYWFNNGMMILDYGMAFDAPGYYFKKLKIAGFWEDYPVKYIH